MFRVGFSNLKVKGFNIGSIRSNSNKLVVTDCTSVPNIAIVQLANEPVNALNLKTMQAINKELNELKKNPNVKGIVLASNFKVFSAGLDLSELYNPKKEFLENFWNEFQDVWLNLYANPCAVAVAINGPALAGGCIISLACDYRVIGKSTIIGLNEATFGLVPPPWCMDQMIRLCGHRVSDKAMSLGTVYNSIDALNIGLVDKIFDPNIDNNNDNNNNNAQSIVEFTAMQLAKEWIVPPGRAATKLRIREQAIDYFNANRKKDVQIFLDLALNPELQKRIGQYIESLSKKKKN